MKKILLSLAAIISVVALAQEPKEFRNTFSNENIKLCVNVAGNDNCRLVVEGATGQVGIGVADPSELLHVEGSSPSLRIEASNDNGAPEIKMAADRGDDNVDSWSIQVVNGGQMNFRNLDTGSFVNKMELTKNGKLTTVHSTTGNVANFASAVDPGDDDVIYISVGESAKSDFGTIRRANRFESTFISWQRSATGDNASRRVLYLVGNDFCTDAIENNNHGTSTCPQKVGDQSSDERIKSNIKPLEYGLAEVLKLKPIRYTRNDQGDAVEIGFSAQKTLSIVPEAVNQLHSEVYSDGRTDDPMDRLGMSYVRIIPVLVNAIQEQQAQIDLLKARLDSAGL